MGVVFVPHRFAVIYDIVLSFESVAAIHCNDHVDNSTDDA